MRPKLVQNIHKNRKVCDSSDAPPHQATNQISGAGTNLKVVGGTCEAQETFCRALHFFLAVQV